MNTLFVVGLAIALIGVLLDLVSTEKAANLGLQEDPRTPYRNRDGSPNVRAAWIVNVVGMVAFVTAHLFGLPWVGVPLLALGLWRGFIGLRNLRLVRGTQTR